MLSNINMFPTILVKNKELTLPIKSYTNPVTEKIIHGKVIQVRLDEELENRTKEVVETLPEYCNTVILSNMINRIFSEKICSITNISQNLLKDSKLLADMIHSKMTEMKNKVGMNKPYITIIHNTDIIGKCDAANSLQNEGFIMDFYLQFADKVIPCFGLPNLKLNHKFIILYNSCKMPYENGNDIHTHNNFGITFYRYKKDMNFEVANIIVNPEAAFAIRIL